MTVEKVVYQEELLALDILEAGVSELEALQHELPVESGAVEEQNDAPASEK
jgi:hypothetical protein